MIQDNKLVLAGHPKSTAAYRKLYANLFVEGSNILKLEKDELQEFIFDNYRDFIALQSEYDDFFKEFGEIKSQFSAFENSLRYIFENVREVKQRKNEAIQRKQAALARMKNKEANSKQPNLLLSDSSDDSDDERNDAKHGDSNQDATNSYTKYQQEQKRKQEHEAISEQIFDLLDNVSITTFEKTYAEAIKTLNILKDMKNSDKYSLFLDQNSIRKTLESHYQVLVDSIVNDIISENPLTKLMDLVSYLKQLKHTPRAAEAYLEVKKRKLAQSISTNISKVGKLEDERMRSVTEDYVKFVLQVEFEFKSAFPVAAPTREVANPTTNMLSFISNWINQSCSVFFYAIQQNVFWGAELEDILENVKVISSVLYEKEKEGLSLNFIMQRLFIDEILLKMDEMFIAYAQRLLRMQNFDDWHVYPVFTVMNVNFCEEEIGNPRLIPVTFFSETDHPDAKRKTLKETKAVADVEVSRKSLKGYQSYMVETNLKGARHSILFWNTIFQLMDKMIQHVDIEQHRIFSAQFIALVESKIHQFVSQYISSFKEVLASVANFSEAQLLSACANINTCLQLSKLSMEYEKAHLSSQIRLSSHAAWVSEWKAQIMSVDTSCFDLIFSYFKAKLLQHIPRLFSEHVKIYTGGIQIGKSGVTNPNEKSLSESTAFASAPSALFLRIASILSNIKENLYLIMSFRDMVYYLNKLINAVAYMIEYIIYWEYHSQAPGGEKPEGLFFMDAQSINRLNLNMDPIKVFLVSNAVRIGFFSKEGLKQFIFDMQFLSILFNESLCKSEKKISYDNFLNKAVSCYCKKKGRDPKEFPFTYEAYRAVLQTYCMNSYSKDLQSVILGERESILSSLATTTTMSQSSAMNSTISAGSNSSNRPLAAAPVKERIFAINLAINNNII